MDKRLEEVSKELEDAKNYIKVLEKMNKTLSEDSIKWHHLSYHIKIKAIYHHKKRKNTTIVFMDNSSITVRLRKGDKDCLETALAWGLSKHLYKINHIVKDVQEVGE